MKVFETRHARHSLKRAYFRKNTVTQDRVTKSWALVGCLVLAQQKPLDMVDCTDIQTDLQTDRNIDTIYCTVQYNRL